MNRAALNRGEYLALMLAGLPALAASILYGGARWWIAAPLAAMSFLGAALWILLRPSGPIRAVLPPGALAWGVWLAWLFVRMFIGAPVPHASLIAFLHAASCLASGLVLADAAARSNRALRGMAACFFIVTCTVAAYAIAQWWRGDDGILFARRAQENAWRLSGTFVSPNHFAHFMGLAICAGLGGALSRRLGFTARLFAAASLVLGMVALAGTLSRAGWLSTFAGLCLFMLLVAVRKRGRFLLLVLLVPTSLATASLVLWQHWEPFQARWGARLIRLDVRHQIWPDIVKMIQDRPLLGHGLGQFEDTAAAYRNRYHDFWATLNHAHNEALQVAADHGLTGLAVAQVCLLLLVAAGVRMLRRRPAPGHFLLAAAWMACLVQSFLHAMFDFSLRVFAINQAFMFISALSAPPCTPPREESAPPPRRRILLRASTSFVALLCAIACVLTGWGAVQQLRAEIRLKTRLYNPPQAAEIMRKAGRIDILNPYFPAELGKMAVDQAFFARDPVQVADRIEEAARCFDRAEALKPRDLGVMRGRMELSILRGEWELALEQARDIARRYPADVASQTEVGRVLLEMGRLGEAVDALQHAWTRSAGSDAEARRLLLEARAALRSAPPPAKPPPVGPRAHST